MQLASVPIEHSVSPRYFACRLELDINTLPEFQGELERAQLSSLFHELVDLAVEIANQGDIP
jgi:hypothetical protein